MECTMNNVGLNIDRGLTVKTSADISNTIEDSDDDSTSENLDSTLNDNEAGELDSTPNSDSCQNDLSVTPQNNMKRMNNVRNGFHIEKRISLTSEPWLPNMNLLELAYKLKQAERRVFGSSNGILLNAETSSEAALKNRIIYNAGELHKSNRDYYSVKFNIRQLSNVSGLSYLHDMTSGYYKASSNKLFYAGSANEVPQKEIFASHNSTNSFHSVAKSPSPGFSMPKSSNLICDDFSHNPRDVSDDKSTDTFNMSSMSVNYTSEPRQRYSESFFDEKRRYPCSYCPYRSDTRSHLKRHELAIHQNGAKARHRLPRVPVYLSTMTARSVSATGVLGESDHRRHRCDQCMYQTNSACHLRRHQSTMHGNEKPFRCNICFLEFSRSEKVNQHFANFHPGVAFNIKAMRKVSEEKRSVQVKRLASLGTTVKRADGGAVDKDGESGEIVDTDLLQLVEAAVAARGEGHKPFGCQQCVYTSRDVWHLRRHIADVHLKRRNYRCKVCRYATGRQDRLFTHMRSHGEMFCLYCDYSTAQVDTYRAHMQSCSAAGSRELSSWNESGDASSVIFSEQEQTCRLCNIAFLLGADLEAHINAVHVENFVASHASEQFISAPNDPVNYNSFADVVRYACRTCRHISDDLELMQDHVMSHAPESYECPEVGCDFKATYARTLELHRKYYHKPDADNTPPLTTSPSLKSAASSLVSTSSTPVKVFNSSDVLQTSTFSSSQSTTITPSTGQYVCPVCKDRAPFKYRRSFEKHITQHSVNVMICPKCVDCFLSIDEMRTHMRSAHGASHV